jgi:hypothetical protein
MIASMPPGINLRDAVTRVAAEMETPLSRPELIQRVLALHPSQARRCGDAIMAEVRHLPTLVHLEDDTFAPLAGVLQGVRFRYIPTPDEVSSGEISRFPCFVPFLTAPAPTLVEDGTGRDVTEALREWFADTRFAPGDSLLFTVCDARRAVLSVRHERADDVDEASLAIQDATLEAILCCLVDRDPSGQPFLEQIIPEALARLHEAAHDAPGRHWRDVVARSPRLRLVDDYALARATFRRPIDRLRGLCATPTAYRNLEARIDVFNEDVRRTLNVLTDDSTAVCPCGQDEALRLSARQAVSFLARQPRHNEDDYRCLALPSVYLARFEGVSLADAEWEMLARFLLAFYPRRVLFTRKVFTARLLSVLRRFYAASPRINPYSLSRLHRLVDRKVALYAELDRNAPEATRLFDKLFPEADRDDGKRLPLTVRQTTFAGEL